MAKNLEIGRNFLRTEVTQQSDTNLLMSYKETKSRREIKSTWNNTDKKQGTTTQRASARKNP